MEEEEVAVVSVNMILLFFCPGRRNGDLYICDLSMYCLLVGQSVIRSALLCIVRLLCLLYCIVLFAINILCY